MKYLLFILSVFSINALAGVTVSPDAKIIAMETYTEYGNGDVIFSISPSEATCSDGYYLRKVDPGYDANLSMLMAAYHADTMVVVRGRNTDRWDGAPDKDFCKVYSIRYVTE